MGGRCSPSWSATRAPATCRSSCARSCRTGTWRCRSARTTSWPSPSRARRCSRYWRGCSRSSPLPLEDGWGEGAASLPRSARREPGPAVVLDLLDAGAEPILEAGRRGTETVGSLGDQLDLARDFLLRDRGDVAVANLAYLHPHVR